MGSTKYSKTNIALFPAKIYILSLENYIWLKKLDMSKKESAWKKFIMLGPATIVSVAYIDPGNFGSNIEAGASFGLSLLWVVWLSSFMAMLFQYLAGKLGIATKKSLL